MKGLISEHDLNCAISSPNALLGSRPCEDCDGAFVQIANETAMNEAGLYPFFSLRSFSVKPMDAPDPGTTIRVRGFRKGFEKPLEWNVEFPSGYHLPLLVKMEKFSKENWKEIYKFEIVADFGYDALDWEYCIDDLEVQFFALPDKGGNSEFESHLLQEQPKG